MGAPAAPVRTDRLLTIATGALLGGTAAVLVITAAATNDAGARIGLAEPIVLLVAGVSVVTLAAAWWWSSSESRPGVARALGVAACGALLPLWALTPSLPPIVRAALLAFSPLVVAGVCGIATGWAGRRLGPWVLGLSCTAVLTHVAGYDPFRDPGCAVLCAHVPTVAGGLVSNQIVVVTAALLTIGAAILAARAVLDSARTAPRVVVGGTLLGLVCAAVGAAVSAVWWGEPTWVAAQLLPGPLGASVAAGAVLQIASRTHRARRSVRELADRLGDPGRPVSGLPRSIAAVHFAMPGGDRWVDAAGEEADVEPARCVSVGPDVRVALRTADAGGDIAGSLEAADLMALSNARLAGITQAHMRDVRAAQRRIVALSDGERLRIEHDLHDGAQQHLVSAMLHLRLSRAKADPTLLSTLNEAEHALHGALQALRDLAHGLVPSLLEAEGLPTALDDLIARSDLPAVLEAEGLDPDLPVDVAMATYTTVAAMLPGVAGHGLDAPLHLQLSRSGDRLALRVQLPIDPNDLTDSLRDAQDRLGAKGGDLRWQRNPQGWTLIVEVPCEA